MEKERRNFAWRFFKSCAASFLMPSWWCLCLILPTSFAAVRLPPAFCQPNLTMEGGSLVVSTFLQGKETRFFAAAAAVTCNVGRRGNFKEDMYKTDKTASTRQKIWYDFDDERSWRRREKMFRGKWCVFRSMMERELDMIFPLLQHLSIIDCVVKYVCVV